MPINYNTMVFVRKINPHKITGDKMANLLSKVQHNRAEISAMHRGKQKWIDRGFEDELCIDMIYGGNSDQKGEEEVANLFLESIFGWNFTQYCGDTHTSCDHRVECPTFGNIRVEVKSAIIGPNGKFIFQNIQPDFFDIIFFVYFGERGVNIEMMNKEAYERIFRYEPNIHTAVFKNTGVSIWRPATNKDGSTHAASRWVVNENSRHPALQGEQHLHDCLGDFDRELKVCLSHMRKKRVCPA